MQQRYGSQGFVAVTVSVDDVTDKVENYEKQALDILKEKKVPLANYILDEAPDAWQKKLNADSVPVVFVFNREGRIAESFKGELKDKTVVDKLAEKLLKEK